MSVKRYTWSHEKQTMDECDVGGFVLYADAVAMARDAFRAGASWGQERANGIHAGGADAEALREYPE